MQRGTLCFECKAKTWWTNTESNGKKKKKNPKGRQKKVRNSTVLIKLSGKQPNTHLILEINITPKRKRLQYIINIASIE